MIVKWTTQGPPVENMDSKNAWGVFLPLLLKFHCFVHGCLFPPTTYLILVQNTPRKGSFCLPLRPHFLGVTSLQCGSFTLALAIAVVCQTFNPSIGEHFHRLSLGLSLKKNCLSRLPASHSSYLCLGHLPCHCLCHSSPQPLLKEIWVPLVPQPQILPFFSFQTLV